jgi:hypothetical protein
VQTAFCLPLLLTPNVAAFAQELALAPLVRGDFELWTGSDSQGAFTIDVPQVGSRRCAFTSKTYFEKDHKRISISRIEPGQLIEVLSERTAEPPRCRALIVRALNREAIKAAAAAAQRAARIRVYSNPSPTEWFAPRGNLLYSGIVVRLDQETLMLRLRSGERHLFQLRPDTRYLGAGGVAAHDQVPLNRPLQVRAGRTYDNALEIFSITWGEILQPQ